MINEKLISNAFEILIPLFHIQKYSKTLNHSCHGLQWKNPYTIQDHKKSGNQLQFIRNLRFYCKTFVISRTIIIRVKFRLGEGGNHDERVRGP
jgi:hypothetical protein